MKLSSFVLLALFLSMVACKKDDTNQIDIVPAPASGKKLMGYSYENNKYAPLSIQYDAQGRVTIFDDGEDVATLKYEGNEVRVSEWRKSENREVFSFTGKLNAQGLLTEGSGISAYNLSAVRPVKFTFEYSSDGYMTRKVQSYDNGALTYEYLNTYTNGNLTSFKVNTNGTYEYGGEWEYDLTKENKVNINWSHFYQGNTFTGKSSKNMAIKYTGKRPGTQDWFSTHQYVYDKDGYPVSCATSVSNGNTYKLLYTFK
jgi:hypothetical protein